MYRSWLEDLSEKHKFARDYTILGGSFYNLEMAQNMMSIENPDYASSDEDLKKSEEIVLGAREKQDEKPRRRRRRLGVVNAGTND